MPLNEDEKNTYYYSKERSIDYACEQQINQVLDVFNALNVNFSLHKFKNYV